MVGEPYYDRLGWSVDRWPAESGGQKPSSEPGASRSHGVAQAQASITGRALRTLLSSSSRTLRDYDSHLFFSSTNSSFQRQSPFHPFHLSSRLRALPSACFFFGHELPHLPCAPLFIFSSHTMDGRRSHKPASTTGSDSPDITETTIPSTQRGEAGEDACQPRPILPPPQPRVAS